MKISLRLFSKFIVLGLAVFQCNYAFSAEENFLLMDNATDEVVLQLGTNIHERFSPASTFKIALSLIGYDVGILKDEWTPTWDFHEEYFVTKESCKAPQTPQSWIRNSCIWYSQILAAKLGVDTTKRYLKSLEYGNQNISGGLTNAWLGSSLKISAAEQVKLIQRMIKGVLQITPRAVQMTKALLFLEELEGGWKLFGKRGLWSSNEEIGWFVGWIEKEASFFPFAYNIHGQKIDRRMVPRVMELLLESKLIEKNNEQYE